MNVTTHVRLGCYTDPVIDRENDGNAWMCHWSGTTVDKLAPEYESIHYAAYEIWKMGTTLEDERRTALDVRLSKFIKDMQTEWIEPCQSLLLGERSNDNSFDLEIGKLKKDLKANFDLDTEESILKLVVECSCDMELEFIAEAILTNGCYTNGLRKIDTDKLTLIYKRIREVCRNNTAKECSREPVMLIMDYELQMLPMENLAILQKEEVCRMHSIASIVFTLSIRSYYEHGYFKHHPLFPAIDPNKGYYTLNVDGDLNFDIREGWFEELEMKGTIKTKPSVEELTAALSAHDLYIYLSHGCGEQYIAAKFIQKMNKCPAALLMGCDSGRVTLCGSLTPKGAPIHYLLGGSPAILCNLWTMGDREIGRFTKDLVLELINEAKTGHAQRLHNPDEEGPSKRRKSDAPVNLGSFLIKCRKSCDLKYLTGASTVCYGLPTSICRKST